MLNELNANQPETRISESTNFRMGSFLLNDLGTLEVHKMRIVEIQSRLPRFFHTQFVLAAEKGNFYTMFAGVELIGMRIHGLF